MLSLDPTLLNTFADTASREWLVTNGLGGWANGTVSGANTRRYHGVFVPALQPPLGRTVLVSKVEETVHAAGQTWALSANEYADGRIAPTGYTFIEAFNLEGLIPTWVYACGSARLQKRLWMPYAAQTTFITYTLLESPTPLTLELAVFVTERDAHHATRQPPAQDQSYTQPTLETLPNGVQVTVHSTPFRLLVNQGTFTPVGVWRGPVIHRIETERGQSDHEDHYHLGNFTATLQPGDTLVLCATLEAAPSLDWATALAAEHQRAQTLLSQAQVEAEPAWVQQLVLGADQFIVQRGAGKTVLAGYPWFSDWGRDTMIALPGLMLTTRRWADAADTLRTFAQFISQGMLPNRFPDSGEQPEYNTVDATLWYFHAIERYVAVSGDVSLVHALWPQLQDIITWHLQGTRYGIGCDPTDGLLRAGVPGAQLTWMDVKIDDWVVTPRHGKPVEINALWLNALNVMAHFGRAPLFGRALPCQHDYAALAQQTNSSFQKFWYAAGGYLYDVLDTPTGTPDPTLRPNQLIALALPFGPTLAKAQAASILEHCQAALLTPYGLRSLAPSDPAYQGRYLGDQKQRDAVYHQGTVWAWLIGPFVEAHFKVYGNAAAARAVLQPFAQHLQAAGLGTISEIFDGTPVSDGTPDFDGAPPFAPRGCLAQAWSVSEVLRTWRLLSGA